MPIKYVLKFCGVKFNLHVVFQSPSFMENVKSYLAPEITSVFKIVYLGMLFSDESFCHFTGINNDDYIHI